MAQQWEAKGSYVFEGGNCIGICDTDNASTAQYERNARLMAAAPDLLSVAQRILDRGYVSESIEEERADHHALVAAIAKSTPSQS